MVNINFSLLGFEYWLLVFIRIASFMFLAPIFGQSAVPSRTKIGFSFFVSVIVYGVIEEPNLQYVGMLSYSQAILKEVVTGLMIGFVANICGMILSFAGSIIDMDIGISMVTEFNQEMGSEVSITGNLYYYFIMILLILSDMHVYVLRAVCDSFSLIPIGSTIFQWDHLLVTMMQYVGDLFTIAFRIFLPFFACMMVLNCVLGVMAKVAPQMNMFAIGIQFKILLGLIVLFLTIFLLPGIAEMIFDEIKTLVVLVIDGLHE